MRLGDDVRDFGQASAKHEASIAKGVATEVLFAMPPAFTVYMTAKPAG